MSHQVRGLESEGTKFGEQLCEAVRWLVTPDAFAQIEFRKDCTWSPWLLVAAAMLWVWSGEPTLNERFDTAIDSEADTVGGFVIELAGRIPVEGDEFEAEGLRFVVEDVQGNRIRQIVIESAATNGHQEAHDA